MKLSLNITKTGNHALDILDPAHNIEAVILEKNQTLKCIYHKEKEGESVSWVLIPQKGMMIQIEGELFRVVEIRREYTGDPEEWESKTVQQHQKEREFNIYAVLVKSRKYTDGLNVLMKRTGSEICNRKEDMCNEW